MQYALLIYTDSDQWQQEYADRPPDAMHNAYNAYTQSLIQSGAMKGGEALEPTSTATTVRLRGTQRLVTDGPFAETKEALGGFYVVEARDLDEAIELAARCPGAKPARSRYARSCPCPPSGPRPAPRKRPPPRAPEPPPYHSAWRPAALA